MIKRLLNENQVFVYFILSIVLLLSFFVDDLTLQISSSARLGFLDGIMLFVTDFGFLFFLFVLIVQLIRHRHFRILALFLISCALAFEAGYLLKLIFQTPRPYYGINVAVTPLTQAAESSFPSIHTAIAFAIAPFLHKIFVKRWKIIVTFVIIFLIAYSRLYLGIHYLSDVLAGGLLGFLISAIIIYCENKYHLIDSLKAHVKDKFELRRQITHLIIGIVIAFLLYMQLLNAQILFTILILGGLLSFAHRKFHFPLLHELLLFFEREEDMSSFPGRGSFYLVAGALLATVLFPREIALASIMIMAVGDSISHIIGRYFGRVKIPFVTDKKLEGIVVAIAFATLGALNFVPLQLAFTASFFAMLFEAYLHPKITKYFNDNLIIPLLAGIIMILLT